MNLLNLTARACVATLLVAGVSMLNACGAKGSGLEAYGRAPQGWVAPEGDDGSSYKKPMPVAAAAPAAKPAPAPAPAAKPAPAMGGDWMYLPTGDRNSSALGLRCGMPREVIAGQNFTYDLEVCNLTSMTLQNVNVTYTLDGARVVSSEPAAAGNGFAVGDLAPKACKTIKITANAGASGSVRGCTGATWNNSLCCATNVVQPALKIVKSVTPDNGTPCDTFTYKIDVTNTGTGAASNVKVTDNLPAGLTSDGKSALNWDLGSIGAGQTVSKTFTAKAGKTGSYSNDSSVTADNNLSAKSNAVNITIKAPALAIVKTCPANQRLGRPATFKIAVTNKGDAPAANTTLEDTVPAGATFVSATDGGTAGAGKVNWNLGTLAPGASKEVSVTMNVSSGAIKNMATARCTCAEAVSADCTFNVQGVPDIGTQITDDNGVVLIPEPHVFRYEVKNQGQVDLTGVKMEAELDDGLDFVSTTWTGGGNPAGKKITFNVGTVKAGQIISFTITCKGTKEGELVIRSTTTSNECKPVRNDEQVNYVK